MTSQQGVSIQLKDPLLRIGLITLFVCVSALASFHFTYYSQTKLLHENLSNELENTEREYAYLRKMEAEYLLPEQYGFRLNSLLGKANKQFNSIEFASALESAVSESGIDLLSEEYDKAKDKGDFTSVEVKVRVKSNYKQIRDFLGLIDQLGFYIVLNKAEIEDKKSYLLSVLNLEVRYLGKRVINEEH